jgi:threonine/homoserine/homoserine lactone efflux protein
MSGTTWAFFVVSELVLCLTPGPAVLFVVSHAVRHGGPRSIWATLGILSAHSFYFLLSAAGLGAALLASHELFRVLKLCGAIYLIYLGLRLILRPGHTGATADATGSRSNWAVVRQGFILQTANPKAVMFFVALLPQFLDPARNIPLQIGILAITSMGVEFLVLAGYGFGAGTLSIWARAPRVARATDRVAGTVLVAAGVGLGLQPSH